MEASLKSQSCFLDLLLKTSRKQVIALLLTLTHDQAHVLAEIILNVWNEIIGLNESQKKRLFHSASLTPVLKAIADPRKSVASKIRLIRKNVKHLSTVLKVINPNLRRILVTKRK